MDSTRAARSHAWHRWLARWTLFSVPGACLAVPFWGVVPMAWTAVVIALLVLGVHVGNQSVVSRQSVVSLVRASGPLVTFCVTFALGWSVLADLSAVAAIAVVMLAGATCPPSLAWYRGVVSGTPVSRREISLVPLTPTATLTALLAAPAERMTDEQLCKAWRDSYVALGQTRTPREKMMIVALRQSFMDALGARHPLGFQAWLQSGPEASGSPDRFLKSA